MADYNVIPSLRFEDTASALAFYLDKLGFTLVRGGPGEANSSIRRGDAHLMIESAADFYSPAYNSAIRQRLGGKSPIALYLEAQDLDEFYRRVSEDGGTIVDPLSPREWGQSEFTIEDPAGNWLTFWKATAS